MDSLERNHRPRAREAGIEVGILPTGPQNTITDLEGVLVGHKTVWQGEAVRTGVTVVLPHSGNLYLEKVPAAIYVGNAYGKLAGLTQVDELGSLETPIALTNTLSVATALRALVQHTLQQKGNEHITSVNAVVGEINDGTLNDIRGMHIVEGDILEAIERAVPRPVEEGSIGAGTGAICLGFKGGIGTSSRRLPKPLGGFLVGVLVLTNYGGVLTVNGAPVGRELGIFNLSDFASLPDSGSCMVVVGTDAPLSSRNLKRLAKRAILGLVRTGSVLSNGSGDFSIAFSTAYRISDDPGILEPAVALVSNRAMSALFLAAIEATEEAVYNSLFKAIRVSGLRGKIVEALPIEQTLNICRAYRVLSLQSRLPAVKTSSD